MRKHFNIAFMHNRSPITAQVEVIGTNTEKATVMAIVVPAEKAKPVKLQFDIPGDIFVELKRGEMSHFKNVLLQHIVNI